MNKIVLTCFEPFGERTTNMSFEVINRLKDYKAYYLKVSWKDIENQIEEILNNENPDILILTGEAAPYDDMKIELQARNIANHIDNYGVSKNNEEIIPFGPEILKTNLNLDKVNVEFSTDAGKYLCNCSYYYALTKKKDKRVIFVHFPINKEIDELVKRMNELIKCLELSK